MEVVETVIKTPKEATELGLALARLVKDVRAAVADGVGADDIPKLLASAMSAEVVAGVQGLDKLGEELKADKTAFVASFVVAAIKIAEDMK